MKKIIIISVIIAICLFTTSCTKAVKKKIQGSWIVEEATFRNHNLKDKMFNILLLQEDGVCELPYIYDERIDSVATWKVERNNGNFYLIIKSDNRIWNQNLEISFDTRRQGDATIPELYLKSEELFLKCSR